MPHVETYQILAGRCDGTMGAVGFEVACTGTPGCNRDPSKCERARQTRVIRVTQTGRTTRPMVEVTRA